MTDNRIILEPLDNKRLANLCGQFDNHLSLGGFTEEAGDFCLEHEIGVADKIEEL